MAAMAVAAGWWWREGDVHSRILCGVSFDFYFVLLSSVHNGCSLCGVVVVVIVGVSAWCFIRVQIAICFVCLSIARARNMHSWSKWFMRYLICSRQCPVWYRISIIIFTFFAHTHTHTQLCHCVEHTFCARASKLLIACDLTRAHHNKQTHQTIAIHTSLHFAHSARFTNIKTYARSFAVHLSNYKQTKLVMNNFRIIFLFLFDNKKSTTTAIGKSERETSN